jgi:hypothetical protein
VSTDRQIWLDNVAKFCPHAKLDPILSGGGSVLAEMCRACGAHIAEYGRCDGCEIDNRRLTKLVVKRIGARRFCDLDCEAIYVARGKAEMKAVRDRRAAKKRYPSTNENQEDKRP